MTSAYENNLFATCDGLIRSGQIDLARTKLLSLKPRDLPRKHRLSAAELCFRSGLNEFGVRLLEPILFPTKRLIGARVATPNEKIQYAILMQRSGSIEEAIQILIGEDRKAFPISNLYLAFCHFSRWEYAAAVPFLESYLAADLKPYQRLVGRVNYGAALFYSGKAAEAQGVISDCLQETSTRPEMKRLNANCLEILTLIAIDRGDLEKADGLIKKASQNLIGNLTHDQIFILQAQAYIESALTGKVDKLDEFSKLALERGQWESVREAELYRLKVKFDESRFMNLYFGSPLPAYRQRIERLLNRTPSSASYLTSSGPCLDLKSGAIDGVQVLHLDGTTHRILASIFSDFFRPKIRRTLFSEVYPGEHFDPYSSPERLRIAFLRAQEELLEAGLPLSITSENGRYTGAVVNNFCLRISLHQKPENRFERLMKRLENSPIREEEFSRVEGAKILGISDSSFKRFARWAMEHNRLDRFGNASYCRYRIR